MSKNKVMFMKIWNPIAFFISLIMSLVMPLIFATPMGMPIDVCIFLWPLRWLIAYILVNFAVNPLGFKLAGAIFNFKIGDKTGIWNPAAFFISLMMSMIMPLIFGLPMNLTFEICLYLWPLRWVVAYCLVNFIVQPLSFRLAVRIFKFNPGAHLK